MQEQQQQLSRKKTMIRLVAENIEFNLNTISVPAGSPVTVTFENKDDSIPHNLAVYTDSSASQTIFKGQIITGPATTTYSFQTPPTPGKYYFRCDIHPTMMNGDFTVT
jgi:plastocyanin